MAAVFPSDRNYRFSSSLMNLKFMKKNTDADAASFLPKHSVTGPALTVLEASRREVEARQQLPGTVIIEEEHSITRLYDLVMGRFSFKGINPVLEAALNSANDSAPEDGEVENTDGKDITDSQMAERSASYDTVGKKFNTRGGGDRGIKRESDDLDSRQNQFKKRPSDNNDDDERRPRNNGDQRGRYFTSYGGSGSNRGGNRGSNKHNHRGRGGGRGGLPRR
ncbi:hypothetical protein BV898_14443 [Hypsibius exemplaris]|uniref:Uncharacterized protein n=1 Tax=Hypsibius exemplaris TaxID=2072580 RepID=A0A9X6RJC3_HYPEX|nr:hypothetical protein BV898_14443 [Hypsibius exemplaris]